MEKINPIKKKKCISCQRDKPIDTGYYMSNSQFDADGRTSVCRDCYKKQIDYSNIQSIKNILQEMNRPLLSDIWSSSEEEGNKTGKSIFGIYIKNIQMNRYKDLGWNDSDKDHVIPEDLSKLTDTLDTQNTNIFENENVTLTQEDIRSQKDIYKLLGYDPFIGYISLDRKSMYAELITYLDEDTLEDQHKISIIIQLINNNNQIRKMDLVINKLSSDGDTLLKNSAEIKGLTGIKKQITDNNDKLAKENAIAIKHRGDKKAGRSTLGYMMKELRELGFENAEEDYYDMKKSYGMQVTADISIKSIISQLNFDEKDIEDMFKDQRELISELQSAKEELEEKLRLANKKINELKSSGDRNA